MKYLIKLKAKTFHLELSSFSSTLFFSTSPLPHTGLYSDVCGNPIMSYLEGILKESTRNIPFCYDETRLLELRGELKKGKRCQMSVEGILNENRIS